jgi:hypothetical protein
MSASDLDVIVIGTRVPYMWLVTSSTSRICGLDRLPHPAPTGRRPRIDTLLAVREAMPVPVGADYEGSRAKDEGLARREDARVALAR